MYFNCMDTFGVYYVMTCESDVYFMHAYDYVDEAEGDVAW